MDVIGRISTGGVLEVPSEVRAALGLGADDAVLWRIDDARATLERIPGLDEVAGSIPVPDELRGLPWEAIRAATHRDVGLGFDRAPVEP